VPGRNTTTRDQHRNTIRQTRAACGICGGPIDYDLPYLDPGSYVVDHIIPLIKGGTDTLDNKQASHRACNAKKAARTDGAGIVKRSASLARPGGQPLPGPRAAAPPA
jgi:5-methylcytosine-specific restriction endonuclease McrA